MNRKQFIQAQGATCRNWTWSWSFINKEEKFIIFGAWDIHTNGNKALIFGEQWERNNAGRKKPAYKESLEHLHLVESGEYSLYTFPMIISNELKDNNGDGPAKIKAFIPKLTKRTLKIDGGKWYAIDDLAFNQVAEEVI